MRLRIGQGNYSDHKRHELSRRDSDEIALTHEQSALSLMTTLPSISAIGETLMGFLRNLRWFLAVTILIGPAIAYLSYTEMTRIQRINASGAEYTAQISGGAPHLSDDNHYYLDLQWVVEGSTHQANVPISDEFARRFVGQPVLESTEIKYLATETSQPVIIVDDASEWLDQSRRGLWVGLAAGLVSLLATSLWFWLDWRSRRREQDIDEVLDQMRSHKPPA